jgi:hypothetical protein
MENLVFGLLDNHMHFGLVEAHEQAHIDAFVQWDDQRDLQSWVPPKPDPSQPPEKVRLRHFEFMPSFSLLTSLVCSSILRTYIGWFGSCILRLSTPFSPLRN